MQSALLLCTLIASFILGVSPIPVPAPPNTGPALLSSFAHANPIVILPTVIKVKMTVTFIDGTTGKDLGDEKIKVFPGQQRLTTALYEAFELDGTEYSIVYKGLYLPKLWDRKWVYFKVTGVPGRCMKGPCFGWMAKGDTIRHWHGEVIQILKTYVTTYVGISLGEPRHGYFVAFKGRPDARDSPWPAVTEARQKEWNKISKKFEGHFMIRPVDGPPPTVTFIDGTGKHTGSGEANFGVPDDQAVLTRTMNDLLGFETCEITYRGRYSPQHLPGLTKDWQLVYFEFTGMDKCTEKPCFGWIAIGAIKTHSPLIYYAGLSLGKPRRGRFVSFKGRPEAKLSAPGQIDAAGAPQRVWNTILAQFQKHFMIHPSLPMTVTFIDMNGGPHQDVPKEIEPFLTAQITLALDVSGSITYSGPYSLKSRYFFKLVGGHPYCLPDDPCFGVVEEQPNGVEGIHPKQNKRHILICQPKVRGLNFIGSGGLDIVGAYPLDPMQQGLLKMVHELHNELVLPLHPEHSK